MTLKDKFLKLTNKESYFVIPIKEDAEIVEKVAYEFAIGFAEWLVIQYNQDTIYSKYTTKELLEIYKKEKGL